MWLPSATSRSPNSRRTWLPSGIAWTPNMRTRSSPNARRCSLVRVVLVGAFGESGGRGARDDGGNAVVREVEVGASLAESIRRRTRNGTCKEIGAVVSVGRSLRERVGRCSGNYRGDAVAVEIEIGAFGDIVRCFLREPVVGGAGGPAGLRRFPICGRGRRPTRDGGVPVVRARRGEKESFAVLRDPEVGRSGGELGVEGVPVGAGEVAIGGAVGL